MQVFHKKKKALFKMGLDMENIETVVWFLLVFRFSWHIKLKTYKEEPAQ